MAERWVEKHAISQLQAALTVSVILAENLKISHFLAGAKFRRHAVTVEYDMKSAILVFGTLKGNLCIATLTMCISLK